MVGLIALLSTLLLGVTALVIYAVVRPFPRTKGCVTLKGLQGDVHIYRDEFGVPQIYASNEADLSFAQGYVHAQDRFWQMELWRHIGTGRLSELIGEVGLGMDRFIRTVGWNRIAQRTLDNYAAQAPKVIGVLESYSAGVNAYLRGQKGRISLSATILRVVKKPWEIEPWTPLHTVAWGVVMADDLGGTWRNKLARTELIKALGEDVVDEILPAYRYGGRPVIVPGRSAGGRLERSDGDSAQVDRTHLNTRLNGNLPEDGVALGHGPAVGSNSFVVSGRHSATGLPLLANDMHLGIQMPSVWYELGLHAPGWEVVGFSFPGVPGVIVGYNGNIAWGITNSKVDAYDLYMEKVNHQNPDQYEFRGQWKTMESITEIIKVNGGADVTLNVKLTHHGPVINEFVDGHEDVLAMRWAAFEPSTLLQSVFALNRAGNYEEFLKALQRWDTPSQNFIYADRAGNIAYQLAGRIPIRPRRDVATAVPGCNGEYDWQGWIPFEDLPSLLNPESGFIVTANNAIVDETYPYAFPGDWDPGDRAQRISDMLREQIARGPVTIEDLATIQLDTKSLLAESFAPAFASLQSDDPKIRAALEYLWSWDLRLRHDSVAAALFEMFRLRLIDSDRAEKVGPKNAPWVGNIYTVYQFAQNRATASAEAAATIDARMLEVLRATVDWFEARFGKEMANWTWGRLHTATFTSMPLGQSGIKVLERLVNRGPFPMSGGGMVVNVAGWVRSGPAAVTVIPAMRMLVDLSNPDELLAINSTGQSGHPFHRHYDDMIEPWLRGHFQTLPLTRHAVKLRAKEHLILRSGP